MLINWQPFFVYTDKIWANFGHQYAVVGFWWSTAVEMGKSGQIQDNKLKLWQMSVPGELWIFRGHVVKNHDCPGKSGTDGHLTITPSLRHTFYLCCCTIFDPISIVFMFTMSKTPKSSFVKSPNSQVPKTTVLHFLLPEWNHISIWSCYPTLHHVLLSSAGFLYQTTPHTQDVHNFLPFNFQTTNYTLAWNTKEKTCSQEASRTMRLGLTSHPLLSTSLLSDFSTASIPRSLHLQMIENLLINIQHTLKHQIIITAHMWQNSQNVLITITQCNKLMHFSQLLVR